jgi:23S rRNA pseudouridine1911/1915/1917 synthase
VDARLARFSVPSTGGRLDHVLVDQLQDYSRSRVQKWIRQGDVRVNDVIVTKTGYALEGGEVVQVLIPAISDSNLTPEAIPLDVIFENEDLLVINKPPGMVVHPSAGHDSGTLVHAVLAHAPDLEGVGGERRPGVVHRLDKDTSGVILFAKNDVTHQFLQRQFKARSVEKTYLALVDGHPPTPSGRIEGAIGRDPKRRQKMAMVPETRGKQAFTTYHTLEKYADHTFLEVLLETGRTHQIRVHMAFLGCPVVGDRVYGRKKPSIEVNHQLLHAKELVIKITEGDEPTSFEAPLPTDFESALRLLREKRHAKR